MPPLLPSWPFPELLFTTLRASSWWARRSPSGELSLCFFVSPVHLKGQGAHPSAPRPYSSSHPGPEQLPTAPGLMNAPLPHQVQPLAVPPLATQAPVCPLPGYGIRGQRLAWSPPPQAPRSLPRGSIQSAALPTFPIVCSVRWPPWEGQPVWPGPSCQALICMQKD